MVFYCDLDNTLIYSSRHDIGADKVGVECYQGQEISFMTQTSVNLLAQVRRKVRFVPTTTRTPEQYARVRLGDEAAEYALVCNGGILLRQGVRDESWYQETLDLIAPARSALAHARVALLADAQRSMEVRLLHSLFLFTKSSDPAATVQRLLGCLDLNAVSVFTQGAKIYVLPISLTKAHAVSRLNQMLGSKFSFAAGDSPMDAGMLLRADKAFAPPSLAKTMPRKDSIVCIPHDQVFSDVLLQLILEHV